MSLPSPAWASGWPSSAPACSTWQQAQVPANRAAGLSFVALIAGPPRIVAPWIFGWVATSQSTSFAFGLCAVLMAVAFGLIISLQNVHYGARRICLTATAFIEEGARGMKAKIKWLDGRAFVGESGSGHAVVMDGAPEAGGRNIGVRPMEMLLIGFGACTAFDVVMILEKGREKVTSLEIELDGERAAEEPKVFTHVKMIYRLKGKNLKPAAVERAIKLSEEKYCSATAMFRHTAKIENEWTVEEG